MNRDSQQWQPLQDGKNLLNLFLFAAHSTALMHEIMFRVPGTMGRRYLGLNALLGIFALPLFAGTFLPPEYGGGWLIPFWWFQVGMVLIHAAAGRIRSSSEHSYYVGDSLLARLAFLNDDTAKSLGEPVAAALIGGCLCGICPTIGVFVIFNGLFVHPLHLGLLKAKVRRQVENARDQRIEAAQFSRQLRELER